MNNSLFWKTSRFEEKLACIDFLLHPTCLILASHCGYEYSLKNKNHFFCLNRLKKFLMAPQLAIFKTVEKELKVEVDNFVTFLVLGTFDFDTISTYIRKNTTCPCEIWENCFSVSAKQQNSKRLLEHRNSKSKHNPSNCCYSYCNNLKCKKMRQL